MSPDDSGVETGTLQVGPGAIWDLYQMADQEESVTANAVTISISADYAVQLEATDDGTIEVTTV